MFRAIISLCLLCFSALLQAQAVLLETPALRIEFDKTGSQDLIHPLGTQPEVLELSSHRINENSTLWFYIPAHQQFKVDEKVLSAHWQMGQSAELMLTLNATNWRCAEQQCVLAEQPVNRIIQVSSGESQAIDFQAYLIAWHKHANTFWQTQKTALPTYWLSRKENRDLYYVVTPDAPLTLYYPDATYVKTQFRQFGELNNQTKAQLIINETAVGWVTPSTTQALEYTDETIGLTTEEFLNVCKQCYLKVVVNRPTLVRLMAAQRPFLDRDIDEELALEHLLPNWYKKMDELGEQILLQRSVSPLQITATIASNSLALKRQSELFRAFTTERQLLPLDTEEPIQSETLDVSLQKSLRLVSPFLYTSQQQTRLTSHRIESSMQFDLQDLPIANKAITLRLRSNSEGNLSVQAGPQTFLLHFLPSTSFHEITLPLDEITKLDVSTSSAVALSVVVDTLSVLPTHPGWYHYASAQPKAPTSIKQALQTQIAFWQQQYVKGLAQFHKPWTVKPTNSQLDIAAAYYQLGEVQQRVSQGEQLSLLTQLDKLLNSPFQEVQTQAWSIYLSVIELQGYTGLAKQYFEALLQQRENPALNIMAAKRLFELYQSDNNPIALRGLCSLLFVEHPECDDFIANPARSNQQWLWLAWYEQAYSLTHNNMPESAVAALGWTIDKPEPTPPLYRLEHGGSHTLLMESGRDEYYLITANQPLVIEARSALEATIRARAPQTQDTPESAWLELHSNHQQQLLPIFTEISSPSITTRSSEALSIAATLMRPMAASETLTITSKTPIYVSLRINPVIATAAIPRLKTQASAFYSLAEFKSKLHRGLLNAEELLNNGLYYIALEQLQQDDFIAILMQAEILNINKEDDPRLVRLYRYGQWQPIREYSNFEGNSLIDLRKLKSFSPYESILRAITGNHLSGIPLRAEQSLIFDLNQLNVPAIRLQFTYQAAAFSYAEQTQVLVTKDNQTTPLLLNLGPENIYGVSLAGLKNPTLQVSWDSPNLAELIYVTVQVPSKNGQWKNYELDDKQRFYSGSEVLPVTFKLANDSLIKLETVTNNLREESTRFYPAGKVVLPFKDKTLARAYHYKLGKTSPLAQYSGAPYLFTAANEARLPDTSYSSIPSPVSLKQNEWYQYAQFKISNQSLYDLEDNVSERVNRILSLGLKKQFENHWLGLNAHYVIEQDFHSYWQANAKYAWQSTATNWFAVARWQRLYQHKSSNYASAWRNELSIETGQRFDIDNQWQLRWTLLGFANTNSVNQDPTRIDPLISPDIYSLYRANHRRGLELELTANYQAYGDQRWTSRLVNRTNDDWHSLEQSYFHWGIQQFYQGQVWQAGVFHRYRYQDEDRLAGRWDHQLDFAWQYPFAINHDMSGLVLVNWRQSTVDGNYALSIGVRLGNEVSTGFEPFASDEILFESLRLSHLLNYSEGKDE